jgi:hypothetical protein
MKDSLARLLEQTVTEGNLARLKFPLGVRKQSHSCWPGFLVQQVNTELAYLAKA